jgi:hypothetical protein
MKSESKKTFHVSRSTLRILGIDPGTAIVGWAIVDECNGCSAAVAYGHIST